ncbi:MAG TPA: efflux RND transporter periplasmic adaptor subunit [Patescibacteria group bacterium]|nr:efflux RND transporter periplasmic adaptor subunit [Patescibacteria group bacterium]
MTVNKKLIAGILLFLVLLAAAAYKLYMQQPSGITATGTVEVTRADITSKTSGYLNGLSIVVGDAVTAGQTIVTIDRPDVKAQLLRDQLALDKAVTQLRDLEKGSRPQEIEQSAAAALSAQAVFQRNAEDYDRYQFLFAQGAISRQQLDSAKASRDTSRETLTAAQAGLSLQSEGNREDVITAQRQEVERNRAIVAASQSTVNDTVVASPLSGLVLTKNYENGEYVNAGSPIATIGDITDCWVKIYLPSTQLGLIKIGQPAKVLIDSYPNRKFSGTIREISQTAEYTPRQSLSQNERANMVFAVKIQIANSDGIFKPGMPADVVIE